MIIYISHYEHEKEIEQAIIESNKKILNSFVTDKINLQSFVKKEYEQMNITQKFIIDLDALEDSEDSILQAVSNFRMLYNAELIIIATELKIGSQLLNDIFCLGIYNIITDKENLIKELAYCLTAGKKYGDSIAYKIEEDKNKSEPNKRGETIVKEKVIIKKYVQKIVHKEMIGFVGTQKRIGTTHNAIACAKFLQKKGFRVAIIENKTNSGSFNEIKDVYEEEIKIEENHFNFSQIDFYPMFDLDNLYLILNNNYNFIIIDYGEYTDSIAMEFSKCAVPIIIAGSKPWELDYINRIFCSYDNNINIINQFYYLFNFTSDSLQDDIRSSLKLLEHIYFQEYIPDFFKGSNEIFTEMLKGYMTEEIEEVGKEKKSILTKIGGILNKYT